MFCADDLLLTRRCCAPTKQEVVDGTLST